MGRDFAHIFYAVDIKVKVLSPEPRGGGGGEGLLPYIRNIGMCRPKGYGF